LVSESFLIAIDSPEKVAMPVIAVSSPKGGAGKTTTVTLLATVLAERGAPVTVIDADPNKNVVDWSKLPGKPDNLSVVGEVSEETIVDRIEEEAAKSSFVIVDLEGTASLMVSYAISMSDFVVIPLQGSQLDAKQAARQMKLIKAQERIAGRTIPFAVLFTRTNPAIMPKTQRFIEERFAEQNVPVFATKLFDREAFRAIFSYGGTVGGLKDKGVSNVPAALSNALELTSELIERLRNGSRSIEKEVA
jgi:chromosome partitioning protein